MQNSLWRNAKNAISGVTLVLAACSPVKRVTALGKDLGHEFGRPIVVSLDRRTHLILVIPPAKVDSGAARDTTDPAALARQVAQYAVAHYAHKGALKSVTVMFDAGDAPSDSGGQSPLSFGNYTWSADDLLGKTKVTSAGTGGEKSD